LGRRWERLRRVLPNSLELRDPTKRVCSIELSGRSLLTGIGVTHKVIPILLEMIPLNAQDLLKQRRGAESTIQLVLTEFARDEFDERVERRTNRHSGWRYRQN